MDHHAHRNGWRLETLDVLDLDLVLLHPGVDFVVGDKVVFILEVEATLDDTPQLLLVAPVEIFIAFRWFALRVELLEHA